MRLPKVPESALSAWAASNNVTFNGIALREIEGKGFGLVTEKGVPSEEESNAQPLLRLPQALVLSTNKLLERAKADRHFQELLAVAGGMSRRGDIMLFLLINMTINSPDCPAEIGVADAWTDYVKMLPEDVLVPTYWSEAQRKFLNGTSLGSPLSAKMVALRSEFETLARLTAAIPWCQNAWWKLEVLSLDDWILLDAWYRSRVLQMPSAGDCMVPCIDMANHCATPKAYYEEEKNGDAMLILRPGAQLGYGQEVCITYGPEKSCAEILFSYGFVEESTKFWKLSLDLRPPPDDPLGGAKVAAFTGRPALELTYEPEEDNIQWISEFVFFMVLNEEDGLSIRVSQALDGLGGKLLVFWQEIDVTNSTDKFLEHIATSQLRDIFHLRAVAMIETRLIQQLEVLLETKEAFAASEPSLPGRDRIIWHSTDILRLREQRTLEATLECIQTQKSELFASPTVGAYLGLNVETSTMTDGDS